MRALIAVVVFGAVLVPDLVLAPEPAEAQSDEDKARSKELFIEGRKAFNAGDYETAAKHYTKAYELSRIPKLLTYISNAYDRLGKIGESLRHLELYAATGEKAALEVQAQLDILRPLFAKQLVVGASSRVVDAVIMATPGKGPDPKDKTRIVSVDMGGPVFHDVPYAIWTDPPGATVYINDKEWGAQGETPYQLSLFPGRHTLWVEMDFHEPIETEILVLPLTKDSGAQKLELKLKRERVPVSIEVRPESAEIIYVSGDARNERLGIGRWKGELPAGTAKFIVQATGLGQREFEEVVRRSAIDETGTQSLVLNLRKEEIDRELAGQSGKIEIKGKLLDGRVFIDGQDVGRTPGSISRVLSPGFHRVELRQEGSYAWQAEVEIRPGETVVVDLPSELLPVPEAGTNWGGAIFTTLGGLSVAGGAVFVLASQKPDILTIAGADTDQLIGLGLAGGGIAALATGILFFALGGDDAPEPSAGFFAVPLEGGWAAGVALPWP